MKVSNEEHYTINMETHYTIQYRCGSSVWISGIPKIKYYLTIEEARTVIEKAFKEGLKEGLDIDEATVIEWKKTPVLVKKNIKPVIKSETTFDVEVYDRNESKWAWRVAEYGFETFKMAQEYIKAHTQNPLYSENYRIIQRDVTVKTSVV